MDNRCTYDTCPKASLLRGLCEQHFLMQFVQPHQKERRRLEDTLALINVTIAAHCQELYKARHPNELDAIHRRPDGAWTNSAKVYCHTCWLAFDGAMECWRHEENCKGKPKTIRREASGKLPKQQETLIDDAEVINDI